MDTFRPSVSYTARIELSSTEVVSLMSVRYTDKPPHHVQWSAERFTVDRDEDGQVLQFRGSVHEVSEHTYPCHIDAIEAGVNHFLRLASQERNND